MAEKDHQDQYEPLEQIGRGSFGVIRKVKRKADGMVLCRKEISYGRMSTKEREQLTAEFKILEDLRHPNIVAYYNRHHIKKTQDMHIYMEYCGNGDLGRYIKKLKLKNELAKEEFVWSIFSQLVMALYRCHYGDTPPDIGSNIFGAGSDVKPKKIGANGHTMILHRDLKPENVFLAEEDSVKLGDFGLSKVIQSHDFASTYVGTPFYMSPEICAGERYSHYSDIWSLGCIIYELCAREPPFNARTHQQLIMKITQGKITRIPNVYSSELQAAIEGCLKVNPTHRPDAIKLLNTPIMKLMRKQLEVVENHKLVKQMKLEYEQKLSTLDAQKESVFADIDNKLRREWETRARLEIDRQVELERAQRASEMQAQLDSQVEIEVRKRLRQASKSASSRSSTQNESPRPNESVSASGEEDISSGTDMTDYGVFDSPLNQRINALKKSTRNTLGRSQTMFAGSPMVLDQQKTHSPVSIASLSLSPRRNGGTLKSKNIFAAAAEQRASVEAIFAYSDDDDDEAILRIPSPTRTKPSKNNPFSQKGPQRPPMISQKTAPMANNKLLHQPSLFTPAIGGALNNTAVPKLISNPSAVMENRKSPNRRMSRIPSSTSAIELSTSPTRRPSFKKVSSDPAGSGTAVLGDDMVRAVTHKNMMKGRTLVELQQARAGGRSVDDTASTATMKRRTFCALTGTSALGMAVQTISKQKENEKEGWGGLGEVPVWDPSDMEVDMPSPFLKRGVRNIGAF